MRQYNKVVSVGILTTLVMLLSFGEGNATKIASKWKLYEAKPGATGQFIRFESELYKYPFEIKYPDDWNVIEHIFPSINLPWESRGAMIIIQITPEKIFRPTEPPNNSVYVEYNLLDHKYPAKPNGEPIIQQQFSDKNVSLRNIDINVKTFSLTSLEPSSRSDKSRRYSLKVAGESIDVGAEARTKEGYGAYKDIFDQILASFKLLPNTPDVVSEGTH